MYTVTIDYAPAPMSSNVIVAMLELHKNQNYSELDLSSALQLMMALRAGSGLCSFQRRPR